MEVLAENLHQSGLEVFFDLYEMRAGDVLVHRLDKGLRARHGVLVVSPAALEWPWVQEEYAAMVTCAVAKQLRLIPVLLQGRRDAAFAGEPGVRTIAVPPPRLRGTGAGAGDGAEA